MNPQETDHDGREPAHSLWTISFALFLELLGLSSVDTRPGLLEQPFMVGASSEEPHLFNNSRTTFTDTVLVLLVSPVIMNDCLSSHVQQGQILVLTDASAAPAKSNSVNQMSERRFVAERPGFEPAAVFISADVLHSAGCTPSRVVIAVYVPLIQSSSRSLITVSWLTVFRRFPKAKAEC